MKPAAQDNSTLQLEGAFAFVMKDDLLELGRLLAAAE
jgi:hypothetical protein